MRWFVISMCMAAAILGGCADQTAPPGEEDQQNPGPIDPQQPPTTGRVPQLPSVPFDYEGYIANAPAHYKQNVPGIGDASITDTTPEFNPVKNEGATLGRVLFYDTRLSANDTIACASCHRQENGFSDPRAFSEGFEGGLTGRKSPGLTNVAFYERNKFFWDERADSLEEQALMPIQHPVEMGMTLPQLEAKLGQVDFYGPLFQAAFGSPQVTSDRIGQALAQFMRSLISYNSKYDRAFNAQGVPDFESVFNNREMEGLRLFTSGLDELPGRTVFCDRCHGTPAHISPNIFNTGLDAVTIDEGAGQGRFKSPSLRNVEVRGPYMHDGRFRSLRDVVRFYDDGVQDNPDLVEAFRDEDGNPRELNLSRREVDALVDFMETLTDRDFLENPMFSNPFRD